MTAGCQDEEKAVLSMNAFKTLLKKAAGEFLLCFGCG